MGGILLDRKRIDQTKRNEHKRRRIASSKIEDIRDGLLYFIGRYEEWGILSAAFPALGCGNGGLEWDTVGPLMFQLLSQAKIPIEIYAPFGTPEYKLTYPFLCQK